MKCQGCGSELQVLNQNNAGYVPNIEKKICQRCFRIQHYNQNPPVYVDEEKFTSLLNSINFNNSSIILVVDVFDIFGSTALLPEKIKRFKNLVVVVNKVDLLPKEVKKTKIKNWATHILSNEGINANNIVPFSATKKLNINTLKTIIRNLKKDIYIVGMTNVGKSSLINNLISDEDFKPIVSHFPNTTLSKINLKFEKWNIIDTPGLRNKGSFLELSNESDYKKLISNHRYKPITFQLTSNQSIFIDKSIRCDFYIANKANVTFYLPNTIKLHRTKMKNANLITENNVEFSLSTTFNSFIRHTFRFIDKEKMTITMSGLGFFSFKGQKDDNIEVKTPEKLIVYSNDVLI